MEGGRCFASSGSRGATRGLPRRCIFTAAGYVLDFVHAGHFDRIFDIVYDYVTARLARTWSSPSCLEFFVAFFELRRRVLRIIRPCA